MCLHPKLLNRINKMQVFYCTMQRVRRQAEWNQPSLAWHTVIPLDIDTWMPVVDILRPFAIIYPHCRHQSFTLSVASCANNVINSVPHTSLNKSSPTCWPSLITRVFCRSISWWRYSYSLEAAQRGCRISSYAVSRRGTWSRCCSRKNKQPSVWASSIARAEERCPPGYYFDLVWE